MGSLLAGELLHGRGVLCVGQCLAMPLELALHEADAFPLDRFRYDRDRPFGGLAIRLRQGPQQIGRIMAICGEYMPAEGPFHLSAKGSRLVLSSTFEESWTLL